MSRGTPMPFIRALAIAISLLLAAACAKEEALPVLALGASDYLFSASESIAGGILRVTLKNDGKEAHHAQFLRLNDGVTQQQFQSTLQAALQAIPTEGEGALGRLFAIVTLEGGPNVAAPGGQNEAAVDLKPGQYVLVCFVPSTDGVPHLAKGMTKPLAVTDAPTKRAAEPKAKATVSLNDFAFQGLPKVSAGKIVLKVANGGQEPHEMTVVQLKGITATQFQQILSAPPQEGAAPAGPPPFGFVGGFQAIMPGGAGWATLDLTAGDYALVCFVPSPANKGQPHFALGMLEPFTVE